MKKALPKWVEKMRVKEGRMASDSSFGTTGAFEIPSPTLSGGILSVIASSEGGWDHVSVSRVDRCPSWEEMAYVKSLWWDEEEVVVQLHPKKSQYVNCHPTCLHLWRPQNAEIPQPPRWMVGRKS